MPNTIVGLSDLLSKVPSPAPQPDTIVGRGPLGEGANVIDPIERQPPDDGDYRHGRFWQDKERYREWLPSGPNVGRWT